MNYKIFRDPIHGFIRVSDCALEIIDTPFFQRLRNIRQLAFSNYIYHGAEHTRFGHSLGVYHLANQIGDFLIKEKSIKDEFSLAALLHDIGHHPFSHSLESALKNIFIGENEYYDHEEYAKNIIEKSEINEIIEKHGYNKNNVMKLLKGQFTEIPHLQYLNHLISSEFDIDRLDYLLRDSYYCGVPYGQIDLERLLYSLKPKNNMIIISDKGLHCAEMYVLSRFYMYTQVYTHKTTRAFDIMLNSLLSKEILIEQNYPRSDEKNIYNILSFDDHWLIQLLKTLSNRREFSGKKIAKMILERKPVKCIVEKSVLKERETSAIEEEYTTISNLRYDFDRITESARIDEDTLYIDEPWKDLPFDLKYHPYLSFATPPEEEPETSEKMPIYISTKNGPRDIASIPYSISHRIARQEAKIIRFYTLDSQKSQVTESIKRLRPNIGHLFWYEKMRNSVPWNLWLEWFESL